MPRSMWRQVRENSEGENPKYVGVQLYRCTRSGATFNASKTIFYITRAWRVDSDVRFWCWLHRCIDDSNISIKQLPGDMYVRGGRQAHCADGQANTRTMNSVGSTEALLAKRFVELSWAAEVEDLPQELQRQLSNQNDMTENRDSLTSLQISSLDSKGLEKAARDRNLCLEGTDSELRARIQEDVNGDGGDQSDSDDYYTEDPEVSADGVWILDMTLRQAKTPTKGGKARSKKSTNSAGAAPMDEALGSDQDGTEGSDGETPSESEADSAKDDTRRANALVQEQGNFPECNLRLFECTSKSPAMKVHLHHDVLLERGSVKSMDDFIEHIELNLQNSTRYSASTQGQGPVFCRIERPGSGAFRNAKTGELLPVREPNDFGDAFKSTAYIDHGTGSKDPNFGDALLQDGFDWGGGEDAEYLKRLCHDRGIEVPEGTTDGKVLTDLLDVWILDNPLQPEKVSIDIAFTLEKRPASRAKRCLDPSTSVTSASARKKKKKNEKAVAAKPSTMVVSVRGGVVQNGVSREAPTRNVGQLTIPITEDTRSGHIVSVLRQYCKDHPVLSKEVNYYDGHAYVAIAKNQRHMDKFSRSDQIGMTGFTKKSSPDGTSSYCVVMGISAGKPSTSSDEVRVLNVDSAPVDGSEGEDDDVEQESSQAFAEASKSPKTDDRRSSRERSARSRATAIEAQTYAHALYKNAHADNTWYHSMNAGHHQILVAYLASDVGKNNMPELGEGQFPSQDMIPWSDTGVQASCGKNGPPARGQYPPKNVAGDPPPIIVKEDADASGHGTIAAAISGLTHQLAAPSASRADTSSLSNLDHKAAQRLAVIGLGDQMREDARSSIDSAKDATDTDATKSATKKMKKVRKAIKSLTAGMSDEAMAQLIGDWVQASCPRPSSSPDLSTNKPELSKFLKTWATQGSTTTVPVPDQLIHASGCQCDQCEPLSSDSD